MSPKRESSSPQRVSSTIDAPSRWRNALLALLLGLVTLAIYLPTLRNAFLDWDDQETVAVNPDFNPPAPENWEHYWTHSYLELYMPLTYTFWGIIAWMNAGPEGGSVTPGAYHLASALLHAICTMLVFLILVPFSRRGLAAPECAEHEAAAAKRAELWAAMLGAALFALHPLQVESVAWVTSTSILLSGALSLWGMWHFLRFDELWHGPLAGQMNSPPKRENNSAWTWLHYAVATIAFGLALLAKPSAVVVPVIVAMLVIGLRRRSIRSLWPLAPWFLMAAAIAFVTRLVQQAQMIDVPLARRIPVAFDALAFYMTKLLVPWHLIPDYGRTPGWLFAHAAAHYTFLIPLVLAILCALMWRKARWLVVGAAIFAVGLLPVLGLTPFSYQKFSTVADRYVYLSMLGPAVVVAFACTNWRRPTLIAASVALTLLLGTLTVMHSRYWKDTPTLFEHTLAINSNSIAAHNALGHWYAAHGDFQRALEHDRAALAVYPRFGVVLYNMGNLLVKMDRPEDAIRAYQRAATESDLTNGDKAKALDNLGVVYVHMNDFRRAADSFAAALKADAGYQLAQTHLTKLRELQKSQQ